MRNFKLFSKRKQLTTGGSDVYQYDVLPEQFRNQVIHILASTLGIYNRVYHSSFSGLSEPTANRRWKILFSRYIHEKGVFQLGKAADVDPAGQCFQYLQTAPIQDVLDFIDCAFQFIDQDLRHDSEYIVYVPGGSFSVPQVDGAIEELNQRFQEHQIGYQFQSGQLIKQTDQYLHEEVMLPALTLLSGSQFRGAQDEFRKAHQHYREQRYKEAVADALKAFESTMKSILDEQKWPYDKDKDTASKLVQHLFEHQLIPAMLQNQFTHLRGLLESGLPTVRNKTSGHGQGAEPVVLPSYVGEYALHLAATNIVFLVRAYEEYKKEKK